MVKDKIKGAEFNTQRTCGLWLVYIGLIIIISAIIGGELLIQPFLIGFGFFIGYFVIFVFPYVNQKLSYGKNSKFQDRMDNIAVFLNIILCTLCGLVIGSGNLRLLWLCIFIAVGIHFFGFYFSQGKIMLLLAALTIFNSLLGLFLISVPFLLFAVIDGVIKIGFGIKMLMQRQVHSEKLSKISL
ncbi:DUF6609 family protein [Aquibacillus rhizosphaerae]|uniref:DUF308 domain-containing protein n=1 Tax=Aquibacillus rhizosphaerae TaxID=3051431 RepID=A0ABT7LAY5_9BACI|nr:DUF6609 family protein [Aquibacillus sp. LR5S19]MDL4842360.1 hypothetical protein [Aquibacillus sp. LR5S19]